MHKLILQAVAVVGSATLLTACAQIPGFHGSTTSVGAGQVLYCHDTNKNFAYELTRGTSCVGTDKRITQQEYAAIPKVPTIPVSTVPAAAAPVKTAPLPTPPSNQPCKTGSFYDPKLKTIEKRALKAGPITTNGVMKCEIVGEIDEHINVRYDVETGTTDGVKYRIYHSDGSGTIQGSADTSDLQYDPVSNWSTSCHIDKVDSRHWCSIRKGDLAILLTNKGRYIASVGYEHYPGSEIVIRVDKREPIRATETIGFSDLQAQKIIEEIKSGSTAVTRFQKWPYRVNRDETIDLFGVRQALKILETLVYRLEE